MYHCICLSSLLYYFHRYYSENSRQIQKRTADEGDIIEYAENSKTSKKSLHFHQEDKIEIDKNKIIYFSTGKSTIDVRRPGKTDKDEDKEDLSHDVPSLKATSEYKLILSYCEKNLHPAIEKKSRLVHSLKSKGITDDIIAKNDQGID